MRTARVCVPGFIIFSSILHSLLTSFVRDVSQFCFVLFFLPLKASSSLGAAQVKEAIWCRVLLARREIDKSVNYQP